jgi:hypothetical protein
MSHAWSSEMTVRVPILQLNIFLTLNPTKKLALTTYLTTSVLKLPLSKSIVAVEERAIPYQKVRTVMVTDSKRARTKAKLATV